MRPTMAPAALFSVALVLCCFICFGSAIRCYECNSAENSQCLMDKPPDSLKINCNEYQKGVNYTMCRKIVQMVEYSVNGQPQDTRVIRTCAWDDSKYKNQCYHRAGYGARQVVCSCLEDDCNGAPEPVVLLPLLVSSLVALKMC